MAELVPDLVLDVDDDAWKVRRGSAWWVDFLAWMRANRMNPDVTQRVEIYALPHEAGVGFARTVEHAEGRRGTLIDRARESYVVHGSTYVLASLPPDMPTDGLQPRREGHRG